VQKENPENTEKKRKKEKNREFKKTNILEDASIQNKINSKDTF
jgi:hypothetical protein